MALTITIPGAIEATTGATAPAVLTIGVGIPGPGVPTGGTTGQVLKKLSSTNYDTAWQTDLNSGVWGSITGTLSSQTDLQTALNLKADLASLSGYAQLSGATFTGEVATPASTTTSAGFSIAPGTAPTSPTNGEIWNTGSDLQVRLGGVTETVAEQSWVTSQLGSYLTSATAASTYASIASPGLTGNVTITTNSASPALIITQDGAGDIIQFKDVTSDTTYAFIDANGKVSTIASTTANAGFNIAHGAAPTTPVNGDVWTTTSGLFARINAGTQQYAPLGSTNTFTGTNTFSGATVSFGTSTAASTINVGTGATLTATTKAVNIGTNGVAGSTTNISIGSTTGTNAITINGPTTLAGNVIASGTSLDLGNTAAASATFSFGSATTTTSQSKTINIGTNGGTGSTTTINIGSSTGGSSTTALNGTVSSTTAAADTNTTQIATTAFVVGQAGSATPLMDNGTAVVGTSLRYARQDHVHPTDTSRAALASPTFTGTPAAPTAAADTNTTQIATTAFVVGQASSTSPVMDGTAAVGTSLKYARADHVHASDTSKANLASPTFTGTPAAPTAAAGTNTTQLATTAFVTAAVPAFASVAQSRTGTSTTVAQNPSTNLWQTMNPGFIPIVRSALAYTATGTMGAAGIGNYTSRMTMGTAGAASGSFRVFGGSQIDQSWICVSKGYRSYIDFSRVTWCSGRFYTEDTWTDPQLTAAFYFGKANNSADGDLARAGFGWKLSGNATASLRNPVLQVHNGTTLTNVTTSFAIVAQQYFDWDIVSLGNGTVTLYINGTQYATTSAGPTADTSYSGTSPMIWSEEFISTGTTAAYNATFGRGMLYIAQ